MEITADRKLKKLIVVGDRVLIKPKKESQKTASGLYLISRSLIGDFPLKWKGLSLIAGLIFMFALGIDL